MTPNQTSSNEPEEHVAGRVCELARLHPEANEKAVLEESRRLARELPDSVTQSLYSLTLLAESARRHMAAGDGTLAGEYIGRLGETARQALKEMRLLVYELRPAALKTEGLIGALRLCLESVKKRAWVASRLIIYGPVELPAKIEVGLFRIAHEALNNASSFPGASQVTVAFQQSSVGLEMEITDNGRGMEPAYLNVGAGVAAMRERAGQLGGRREINSASGSGTRVKLVLPATLHREHNHA